MDSEDALPKNDMDLTMKKFKLHNVYPQKHKEIQSVEW